jgi:hypothetical protein
MKLVTLTDAKAHCRVDFTEDDTILDIYVQAASQAVLDYLKSGATFLDSSGDVPVDSSGDPEGIPFNVQAATLVLTAEMYRNREALTEDPVPTQHGYGYLPRSVTALLYPLRDPALA